jgi:hypothetical protein
VQVRKVLYSQGRFKVFVGKTIGKMVGKSRNSWKLNKKGF